MWAVCAASPALAVPSAFIYAVSVNIHLYPTAADDISHPSQAFVRQLNPVPIALAGRQWNGNLNSLLAKPPADSGRAPLPPINSTSSEYQ